MMMSPPGSVPSVVHDQHRWTVFDSQVNLPAALNDPLRVKRETDFFTKTWGQEFYEKMYVPESRYLPDIDRKYFEKYKHRISKVYSWKLSSLKNIEIVFVCFDFIIDVYELLI